MKKIIVFLFVIFTLVSTAQDFEWINSGEYFYIYFAGKKTLPDYALTEDGKSVVLLTDDTLNPNLYAHNYHISRINIETGATEFDSLINTDSKHFYRISNDGLTAFDVNQYRPGWSSYVAYKLFDIEHSSKGPIYQEVLLDDKNPIQSDYTELQINNINFQHKTGIISYGTNRTRHRSYWLQPSTLEISGEFSIFDYKKPTSLYKRTDGSNEINGSYNGMQNFVFDQFYNFSSGNTYESHSKLILVDSNKKESEIIYRTENEKPKSAVFLNDSILVFYLNYSDKVFLQYYNYKTGQFTDTMNFRHINSKHGFHIGFSNDGKYFVKSDNHKVELFKHYIKYPIYSFNIPDTLNKFQFYRFSGDDKYIFNVNNSKQLLRFKNPLVDDNVKAYFVLSDTSFIADKAYKCYNFSTANPTKYSWDFNNGITSNDFEPEIRFNEPGNYTIKLIAEKDGKQSTYEKIINVLPNFYADFEIVSIPKYLPMNCKFKNTSTSNIDSLLWDFGDGVYSKSKETYIYHTYAKDYDYRIKLKVFYKTLLDSSEKIISIKNIADQPFDPEIYTEYLFENTTDNNHKICKILPTEDKGFILIEQRNDTTALLKSADDLVPYKTVVLNKPFNCPADNLNDIYFNNFLIFDKKNYIFYTQTDDKLTTISIFDEKLNKTKEIDSIDANFHLIAFPDDIPDSNIVVFESKGTTGYINKYNAFTGKKTEIENLGNIFYLMNDTMNVISLLSYNFAYSPISHTYSNFSSFKLQNPNNGNFLYEDIAKNNLKLKKPIPFKVFRNIDNKDFVGLDTRGNVVLFNAQGDSLDIIKLTSGLTNIAVNGLMYCALGTQNNHPICYLFDRNLSMKDTIYIVNRDGAFIDALILENGDILLAGYRLLPSKSQPNGKSIRNSYILRVNNKTSLVQESVPNQISITNPIDYIATIRFSVDTSTVFHYEAYDLLGNLVFKTVNENIESDYTGTVDFSGLAPGVYIFKFYINGKIETKKVIYQK